MPWPININKQINNIPERKLKAGDAQGTSHIKVAKDYHEVKQPMVFLSRGTKGDLGRSPFTAPGASTRDRGLP